jgi:hypothetical protein
MRGLREWQALRVELSPLVATWQDFTRFKTQCGIDTPSTDGSVTAGSLNSTWAAIDWLR